MKKKFSKLSKAKQEKAELQYHQMKPEDFDRQMAGAKRHSPEVVRFPKELVETLKALAQLEGEPQYQAMVTRWVEERLQHEARLALKLSKMPLPELIAILERRVPSKKTATV